MRPHRVYQDLNEPPSIGQVTSNNICEKGVFHPLNLRNLCAVLFIMKIKSVNMIVMLKNVFKY